MFPLQDQNVISDAGLLRQRPKLTQAKLQNLSLAQNSFTSTGARALGKAIATNARGKGLSAGSVQVSTFVFSMKELQGTADEDQDAADRGGSGAGRLNLAQQQVPPETLTQ